jgi:hypothetical protein
MQGRMKAAQLDLQPCGVSPCASAQPRMAAKASSSFHLRNEHRHLEAYTGFFAVDPMVGA